MVADVMTKCRNPNVESMTQQIKDRKWITVGEGIKEFLCGSKKLKMSKMSKMSKMLLVKEVEEIKETRLEEGRPRPSYSSGLCG